MSFPESPLMESLPEPAVTMSLPAPPKIVLPLLLPVMVSLPLPIFRKLILVL